MDKTKAHKKCKSSGLNKTSNFTQKKNNMIDAAIITLGDFERIMQNSKMVTKYDEMNAKTVNEMQISNKRVKGQDLKERIIQYDKTRTDRVILSDLDKENLEMKERLRKKAQDLVEQGYDSVKDMNKLIHYSRVAGIRDRQQEQNKRAIEEKKIMNVKMDYMMELDRLKLLQKEEEVEQAKKEERYKGKIVIVDQMHQRKLQKQREKEIIEEERLEMVKKMKELEDEEKQQQIDKQIYADKQAKETAKFNRENEGNRERRKREGRELDLRMLKYQMDKAKKEEDDILEKK
jgi:hypothetical protein